MAELANQGSNEGAQVVSGVAHAPRHAPGVLAPHPELWRALGDGALLRQILEAFYAKVYADPRLAPYFAHTTIEWAIDHQYAFMGQIFSGIKLYFGDRPRNAHHRMIISDELFEYRETLMMQTLEAHGLSRAQRDEWRAVEEAFRPQIVKDAPWPKKRRGVALPLRGFESLELTCGCLCDACAGELPAGTIADYDVRNGRLYCARCIEGVRAAEAPVGSAERSPEPEDDELVAETADQVGRP